MNLSKRLSAITEMVSPCETAADIGCDHGFTSISLVQRGKAAHVYAADINEGPLQRAAEHVKQYGLEEQITLCLGNGLSALKEHTADCIIIAGMGGILVKSILLSEKEKVLRASELVLSPHTEPDLVREILPALSFEIREERMIYEDEKYYVIIRAVKVSEAPALSDAERKYGPCLIREKSESFMNYLRHEQEKMREIREKLQKNGTSSGALEALRKTEADLGIIDFILKN